MALSSARCPRRSASRCAGAAVAGGRRSGTASTSRRRSSRTRPPSTGKASRAASASSHGRRPATSQTSAPSGTESSSRTGAGPPERGRPCSMCGLSSVLADVLERRDEGPDLRLASFLAGHSGPLGGLDASPDGLRLGHVLSLVVVLGLLVVLGRLLGLVLGPILGLGLLLCLLFGHVAGLVVGRLLGGGGLRLVDVGAGHFGLLAAGLDGPVL